MRSLMQQEHSFFGAGSIHQLQLRIFKMHDLGIKHKLILSLKKHLMNLKN